MVFSKAGGGFTVKLLMSIIVFICEESLGVPKKLIKTRTTHQTANSSILSQSGSGEDSIRELETTTLSSRVPP
jgi:hypothetical protein